jgi:excisionase family DNA binding protein
MVREILTTEQAAEYLQLSVETVKRKARAGRIPAAKIGREWRFSRRQLLEWVERQAIPEELVDEGIMAVVAEQMADEGDDDWIPWEEVKASLGL